MLWRRSTDPGFCPACQYDLTGNTSGVCPECGAVIVSDPDVPRHFYARRFWWLPELSLFPDAGARHAAWKKARHEQRYTSVWWISGIVWALMMTTFFPAVREHLGPWWWKLLLLLATALFATIYYDRQALRRNLRRQAECDMH